MKRLLRVIVAAVLSLSVVLGAFGCGKTEYAFKSFDGDLPSANSWTWKKMKYSEDPDDPILHPYEDYNETYEDYPFFTDKKDVVTYFMNSMFKMYSDITDASIPYTDRNKTPERYTHVLGTSAWYEWLSTIKNWGVNEIAKSDLKRELRLVGILEDGYVYSWGDMPHWPDLGFGNVRHSNYHYDGTFNFVIACASAVLWENSTAFLSETDTTSADEITYHPYENTSCHAGQDVSKGKTVGEKMDMAINYILTTLHGEDGLIIIDENCNDGNNLGKKPTNALVDDSVASNYWDNIPFGYKDAYENIRFYQMLDYLVKLETLRGNTEKAGYYSTLMATAKQKFNDTFWVENTKRYAGTIDVNGVVRDYGFTFINTEAVTMGLAPEDRAKHIYAWLDGLRIVEGDTSTGEDIYKTYKSGGIAPRSNTVDLADSGWWHDNNGGQALSSKAQYGYHVENGGAIMYTEFHDIMGRLKYIGADNAMIRLYTIATEYAKDALCRDPLSPEAQADVVLGIINEFPETGLVPTAWVYGMVGVSVNAGGIDLSPSIPSAYNYIGVKDVCFGGKAYTITVARDGKVTLEGKAGLDIKVNLADYCNLKNAKVTTYGKDGVKIAESTVSATNGIFKLDYKGQAASLGKVVIEKA